MHTSLNVVMPKGVHAEPQEKRMGSDLKDSIERLAQSICCEIVKLFFTAELNEFPQMKMLCFKYYFSSVHAVGLACPLFLSSGIKGVHNPYSVLRSFQQVTCFC